MIAKGEKSINWLCFTYLDMPKTLHCAEEEIDSKGVSKIGTIRISDTKTDVTSQASQVAKSKLTPTPKYKGVKGSAAFSSTARATRGPITPLCSSKLPPNSNAVVAAAADDSNPRLDVAELLTCCSGVDDLEVGRL